MINDPILEEVRLWKRELAEEAGYDIHKIFERIREAEKQHPDDFVNLREVKEEASKKDGYGNQGAS